MSSLEPSGAGGAGAPRPMTYEKLKTGDVKVAKVAIPRIHETVGFGEYDAFIDFMMDEAPEQFTVAKDSKGEIQGYVVATPNQDKTTYVSYIAVDKHLEKQGVGTGLMVAALEKAKREGMRRLTVEFRQPLAGFYEKVGSRASTRFEIADTGTFYKGGVPRYKVTYFLNT